MVWLSCIEMGEKSMGKIKIGLTIKIFTIMIIAFGIVFIYSIHIDLERYRIDYLAANQEENVILSMVESNQNGQEVSFDTIKDTISKTNYSKYGYYFILDNNKQILESINCYDFLKTPQYTINGHSYEAVNNLDSSKEMLSVDYIIDLSSLSKEQYLNLENCLQPYYYDTDIAVSGIIEEKEIYDLDENGQEQFAGYQRKIKPTYLKVANKVILGKPDNIVYKTIVTSCNTPNYYAESFDFGYYQTRNFVQEQDDITKAIQNQIKYDDNGSFSNTLRPFMEKTINYSLNGFNQRDNWYGYSLGNLSYRNDGLKLETYYILYVQYFPDFKELSLKAYISNNKPTYYVSLIIVSIISMITSLMITGRIKKIDKAARRFAKNEFNQKLDLKGHDELTSLSNHLNIMAENLKLNLDSLNMEIDQVKKLEKLRKEFVANFTHEIKTPLAIINGNIELLEESNCLKDKSKYLDVINHQIEIINTLILQMLDLSKLEAKAVVLNRQRFDLENLVVDIIDDNNNLLLKKQLKIDLNSCSPIIDGDRQRLAMVIQNFVTNAIKHSYTDSIITINLNEDCFEIINYGKKLSDDLFDKIWDSFISGDNDGTGLGLAICKNILELHQFNYGLENVEDGIMFYFKFGGVEENE